MNLRLLLLASTLCAPLAAQEYQFAIRPATSESVVAFHGDTDSFSFVPDAGGYDFQITDPAGGLNDLWGRIEGVFTIAGIVPTGPYTEAAAVSGIGLFSIDDGAGHSIVADLSWVDAFSIDRGISFNGLNITGAVNLTNFRGYDGTSPVLTSFLNNDGVIGVSFEFNPGRSLTELTADGTNSWSTYSGDVIVSSSLAAIPEPAAATVIAGVLVFGFAIVMKTTRPRPDTLQDV